ncbi:hypothetical protein PES01_01140 [Pseudoalteromonas espejiana]|uniref:Uncharacterized protein n=1 Tax=Pseudoalteromonas espejiana TaxID=28107 RepID=A0A510XQK7_9GAMM|nr:hypothetical protein PES01_01140 [Pseudoalteromonas espejiana]
MSGALVTKDAVLYLIRDLSTGSPKNLKVDLIELNSLRARILYYKGCIKKRI